MENINRREFLDRSQKSVVGLAASMPILAGSTAEHIERDPRQPFAVLINAWNEWTEGCYLLPEQRTGTARLEAIKRTFGAANG